MHQPGSYAAGVFGRNNHPVPFQRINETSFSDGSLGSLGAIQRAPRQQGAYRSGSLGNFDQPGAYRSGSLGLTAQQAQANAAAASRAYAARSMSRSGTQQKGVALTFKQTQNKRCRARCNDDFRRIHHNQDVLASCSSHCDMTHPVSGLGLFETLPPWALYLGGAVVLGGGYFLFFKKKR